ncbi:pirin family protein [Pantanalinema rosaneae CENA516]|uniref:pirin family protein n=1 Tax=Pantanalinema rosaneae TaxID=1620701 RepID=UPI003D6E045E
MITIRKSADRGHANYGWLDTYYSFSFANYYDPKHMGFRHLRVINEDRIAPGNGFPTHPHRDMEIISYVVDGSLAHRDSLGNGETIGASGIQRFTAGTGITHSEFNPSSTESTHLLQIWILPEQTGIKPSYEQKLFPADEKRGQWRKLASPDATDGAVKVHQNMTLYATILSPGEARSYTLQPDRHAWIQVVKGDINLNDRSLSAGDGAAVSETTNLTIEATTTEAEVLLFDLA